MTHVACMIDLETFGTTVDCAIISMSAQVCNLDDRRGFVVESYYNKYIQLEGQTNRRFDGSTVAWWFGQSLAAQQEIKISPRVPIHWALKDFWTWYKIEAVKELGVPKITSVWSKGVDFDVAILEHYYKSTSQDTPWHYRDKMCYRTMAAMFPEVQFVEAGIKHSAAGDCLSQLTHLWQIWGRIMEMGFHTPDSSPSLLIPGNAIPVEVRNWQGSVEE